MAKQFSSIQERHREFILKQKLFFTASAAPSGYVNVSPKGLDTFRYLGPNEVAYLDLTGSGNETAAHIKATANGRLTFMFCAFEGPPLILRLYGRGQIFGKSSQSYKELIGQFDEIPGARQIVHLQVELVQTSCGFGVPFYEYKGDRPTLTQWAENKGEAGLEKYRQETNLLSIDGFPTGLDLSGDDPSEDF